MAEVNQGTEMVAVKIIKKINRKNSVVKTADGREILVKNDEIKEGQVKAKTFEKLFAKQTLKRAQKTATAKKWAEFEAKQFDLSAVTAPMVAGLSGLANTDANHFLLPLPLHFWEPVPTTGKELKEIATKWAITTCAAGELLIVFSIAGIYFPEEILWSRFEDR